MIAVSGSAVPSFKIIILGERHCSTGTKTGAAGIAKSDFFLMVTTAPVSDATALIVTLPEYVVALNPVMDPPIRLEVVYL